MSRLLAFSGNAVMAGDAGADNLRMVDCEDRYPDVRVVTILTHVAGLNVRIPFTLRLQAVVAADAVTRNVQVVEVCGKPADCRVAIVAVIAAGDV